MVRSWGDFGIGRLLEESRDPVVLVDDHGTVVLWNRSASAVFGYSAREAVGMNIDRIVPSEHADAHHAGIERFRRTGGGAIIDGRRPVEVPALRKDGQRIWIELALTPIERRGKRFALGIAREVTERVQLRERQSAQQRQLEDANRTLEAFAHVVGHDLKEPVRGMGAYLQALTEETDPEERKRLLDRTISLHRDLQGLLQGLLEWSRTATAPADPEPLQLAQVLRDPTCIAQWGPLAEERGARIDIAESFPAVMGTTSLVCRVFGNLVTNAIRHNPAAAPRVAIRAAQRSPPGMVDVWVEDDGPGFPPAVVDALTHDPRSLRSGFGLAITRRAVERLRGELEVENTPEGGRVCVRLPAASRPIKVETSLEERVRELV